MKVAVIGAGSWGVWTALELQKRGIEVNLYDIRTAGNELSGSGGISRIIRMVYGSDIIYSQLTEASYDKWDSLFRSTGDYHYTETGVLWLQTSSESKYLESSQQVLSKMGYPIQEFEIEKAIELWPRVNFDNVHKAFFERKAGILDAALCCKLALYRFIEDGGTFIEKRVTVKGKSVIDENGRELLEDQIIFATGSWTRGQFPDLLNDYSYVSRQEVFFYNGLMKEHEIPVWADIKTDGIHYYGFPPHQGNGLKVAFDIREHEMDPETDPRDMTPALESEARKYLELRFPSMKGAKLEKYKVCHYDNSLDGDYIIDFHPDNNRLMILTGSSGHGFKLGPGIGQLVSEYLLDNKPLLDKFVLSRFTDKTITKSQFN